MLEVWQQKRWTAFDTFFNACSGGTEIVEVMRGRNDIDCMLKTLKGWCEGRGKDNLNLSCPSHFLFERCLARDNVWQKTFAKVEYQSEARCSKEECEIFMDDTRKSRKTVAVTFHFHMNSMWGLYVSEAHFGWGKKSQFHLCLGNKK